MTKPDLSLRRNLRQNKWYRLGGIAAAVTPNIVDNLYTLPAIKLFNKSEFREKGLGRLYMENSLFIGKHPTVEQFRKRSFMLGLTIATLSAVFPEAGYLYLASMPFVVYNNVKIRKCLEQELEK